MTRIWLVLLATLNMSFVAFAQDASTEPSPSVDEATTEEANQAEEIQAPAGAGVEKIEVTGSHIKRINIEGPSPILVIDREQMDRSGYNSVADVLRDSTITANGVGRESTGVSTSGSATTGLRGFTADKILVLLNGQRLPKIGGENTVDLNLIPFQAIERVEILKDGASATYGSDALAGVINFITKKDYDGASIMLRHSHPNEQGGARTDIAAVYGKNFSKGNFMAVYQYRSNRELRDQDRDYSNSNGIPISTFGSPGSFRPSQDTTEGGADDDAYQPDPTCAGGPNDIAAQGGRYCGFDYTPFSWRIPSVEQHSAVLSGSYDLNESLNLYANVLYTRRQSAWQFAPAPDEFKTDKTGAFEIPATTANNWPQISGLTGGEPVEVRYRLVEELGPRSNRDTTDSYGGTAGVKGYYMDTWEWDFALTYGASNVYSNGFSGYANKQTLFDMMNNNQFNPFSATKADLSSARTPALQWIDSSLTFAQFRTSGELGQLGGGILSSAFGLSAAWEDFDNRVDAVSAAGNLFGGSAQAGSGSRNYQALFAELGWALGKWEFQLAGRMDRYSDFGETFNPKFAFRYLPIKELMLRGSVGTGFKAPSLDELYASQGYGFPTYVDQKACNNAGGDPNLAVCQPQQYQTLTGGNPNLEEETSFSYNMGALVQPTRDFSISLDYWYTEIDGAIGLDLDDVMLADSLGLPLPTGVAVNRNQATGDLLTVDAPLVNISKQRANGLDLSMDYFFKLGSVTINPHMDHSHFLDYREIPLPGLPEQSRIDWSGRPRWRNTIWVAVGFLKDHNIRTTARTVAGQFFDIHRRNQNDGRRVPTYTEYDIDYRYNMPWDGQLTVGVKNVLNSDRPLDFTQLFPDRLNTSIYDPIGQLVYLGYTQNF